MSLLIKSCPFCGGEGYVYLTDVTYLSDKKTRYYISCIKCQARIGFQKSKKDAINIWNTRAKENA